MGNGSRTLALRALVSALLLACLTYLTRHYWSTLGPELVVFALALSVYVSVFPRVQSWLEEAQPDAEQRRKMEDPQQAAKAFWGIASERLITDQHRTRVHLNCLFGLILLMVLLAFSLIVVGCWLLLTTSTQIETGKISAISGTVVAFMSGSALVVYNRLMDQANMHSRMLERLNIAAYARDLIGGIKDESVKGLAKEKLALEIVRNSKASSAAKSKKAQTLVGKSNKDRNDHRDEEE